MVQGRGVLVVGAVSVALLLFGCTTSPTSPPSPTSSSTSDPTPTAPAIVEPTSRIELSCEEMLPAADVAAALGAEWEAVDPVADWARGNSGIPPMTAIQQAGGLACAWSPGIWTDPESYPGFQVWVLPDAEDEWSTYTALYGCAADASECAGSHFVSGRWVEIVTNASVGDLMVTALAAIGEAPAAAGTAWPPAGSSPLPEDCRDLVSASAVREATGSTVEIAISGPHGGYSAWFAAQSEQDAPICLWFWIDVDAGPGHLERLPGGAWAWERVRAVSGGAAAAEAFEIEGAPEGDSAWIRCEMIDGRFPGCIVDLIVGGNWLEVQVFEDDGTGLGPERLTVDPRDAAIVIATEILHSIRG